MHFALAKPNRRILASLGAAALLAGCGGSSASTKVANTPAAGGDDQPVSSATSSPAASAGSSSPAEGATASADPAAPAADAADGLVHVVDKSDGYSLALPAGWVVVKDDANTGALVVTGPQGKKLPPSAATQAKALYKSGAKLIAVEPTVGKFSTNVNVIMQPSGSLDPNDIMNVVPSAKKALAALHPSSITSKPITLSGQKAAEIDYAWVVPASKQHISARVIYALHGGNAYIITISRATGVSAASTDVIARNIRFS